MVQQALGRWILIKLNIGCGYKKISGYINLDVDPGVAPDLVCSIENLCFSEESCDVIYACHVLEHVHRENVDATLLSLYNTLKSSGILRLAVPDFDSIVEHYLKNKNLTTLIGLLYGRQETKFNFHYSCWNFECLSKKLIDVGFQSVKVYDWKLTDHSYLDDYSQSYLPHMHKESGKLMSLNVEAIK